MDKKSGQGPSSAEKLTTPSSESSAKFSFESKSSEGLSRFQRVGKLVARTAGVVHQEVGVATGALFGLNRNQLGYAEQHHRHKEHKKLTALLGGEKKTGEKKKPWSRIKKGFGKVFGRHIVEDPRQPGAASEKPLFDFEAAKKPVEGSEKPAGRKAGKTLKPGAAEAAAAGTAAGALETHKKTGHAEVVGPAPVLPEASRQADPVASTEAEPPETPTETPLVPRRLANSMAPLAAAVAAGYGIGRRSEDSPPPTEAAGAGAPPPPERPTAPELPGPGDEPPIETPAEPETVRPPRPEANPGAAARHAMEADRYEALHAAAAANMPSRFDRRTTAYERHLEQQRDGMATLALLGGGAFLYERHRRKKDVRKLERGVAKLEKTVDTQQEIINNLEFSNSRLSARQEAARPVSVFAETARPAANHLPTPKMSAPGDLAPVAAAAAVAAGAGLAARSRSAASELSPATRREIIAAPVNVPESPMPRPRASEVTDRLPVAPSPSRAEAPAMPATPKAEAAPAAPAAEVVAAPVALYVERMRRQADEALAKEAAAHPLPSAERAELSPATHARSEAALPVTEMVLPEQRPASSEMLLPIPVALPANPENRAVRVKQIETAISRIETDVQLEKFLKTKEVREVFNADSIEQLREAWQSRRRERKAGGGYGGPAAVAAAAAAASVQKASGSPANAPSSQSAAKSTVSSSTKQFAGATAALMVFAAIAYVLMTYM